MTSATRFHHLPIIDAIEAQHRKSLHRNRRKQQQQQQPSFPPFHFGIGTSPRQRYLRRKSMQQCRIFDQTDKLEYISGAWTFCPVHLQLMADPSRNERPIQRKPKVRWRTTREVKKIGQLEPGFWHVHDHMQMSRHANEGYIPSRTTDIHKTTWASSNLVRTTSKLHAFEIRHPHDDDDDGNGQFGRFNAWDGAGCLTLCFGSASS
jgi:hypothetical protein